MSDLELGAWSFPALMLAIFLRVPIGLAMLLFGIFGTWLVVGSWVPVLSQLKSSTFDTFSSYSLSIIPLFLLMGQFATRGGMSQSLFSAAAAWLGHRKGGVGMAAIGACAGFGAICGSSLATAATMGKVALPELRRYGYADSLATGCLAAGGTLGVLIPPSVVLVIYAILAEENIARLFTAAIVPGIVAALMYMVAIGIYVRLRPGSAGATEPVPMAERLARLRKVWPVVMVFLLVIGGINLGWFTPTEGAAVGAAATGLIAVVNGGLDRRGLWESIEETAVATAMIFFIIFGAGAYNTFLAFTQLPMEVADWIGERGYSPYAVLILILACYIVFGCFMDSLSMILLTIPIFLPIVTSLDYGLPSAEFAIWFGILVLVVVEMGLITPPVGMNLFVINSVAGDVPMAATFRGVLPFVATDIVRITLLVLFPGISLWLVRML